MFVKIAVCGYGGKGRVFVKIVTVVCVFLATGIYARVVLRSLNVKIAGLEMPILPGNKKRYPANWKEIRDKILAECENKCEFCGVENHSLWNGKRIILTIARLDHMPENCARENAVFFAQETSAFISVAEFGNEEAKRLAMRTLENWYFTGETKFGWSKIKAAYDWGELIYEFDLRREKEKAKPIQGELSFNE